MDIDVKGINCSGVSFTEGLLQKYVNYYETVHKHKEEYLTYIELQRLFEEELHITESATRVDIPFLYNNGLINEYRKEKINLDQFFTNLGKSYYEIIKIKNILNDEEDAYFNNKINEINSLIILEMLFYRKKTNNEEYYLKMLKFISDYTSLDEKEFYLMVRYEEDIETLNNYIEAYRKGEIDINLINANNTYQYTKKMLIQADVVIENKEERRLYLNEKMRIMIEELLK